MSVPASTLTPSDVSNHFAASVVGLDRRAAGKQLFKEKQIADVEPKRCYVGCIRPGRSHLAAIF